MSNVTRMIVFLLVCVVLMLLFAAPVLAQDAPPAASEAGDTLLLTWQALAGLVSIALTIGFGGGVAGALAIIKSIQSNDALKTAIEKLYLSASPDTQRLLRNAALLGHEAGKLADELTDGKMPVTGA